MVAECTVLVRVADMYCLREATIISFLRASVRSCACAHRYWQIGQLPAETACTPATVMGHNGHISHRPTLRRAHGLHAVHAYTYRRCGKPRGSDGFNRSDARAWGRM